MVGLTGTWLPAILAFFAVGLAAVSLAVFAEWWVERRRSREVASQLERLAVEGIETVAPGAGKLFRGDPLARPGWLDFVAEHMPQVKDLEHRLKQAALAWSVNSFIMLSAGIGLATGLGTLLVTGKLLYGFAVAPLGLILPYLYVARRRTKRLDSFEERFPDAIDLLGRAIRAGHPLSSGLKMVAEEMDEPISGEFRQVFEEQRFGLPFEDSVTGMADRMPLADVRIFVTALLIQREVGGNLAEILDNLASIIRQRFILRRHVRVLTAEGRLSGVVLTVLPVGIGLWVFASNPEYIMVLFEHPIGKLMLGGAALMQVVGFFWMRRITNIEF